MNYRGISGVDRNVTGLEVSGRKVASWSTEAKSRKNKNTEQQQRS